MGGSSNVPLWLTTALTEWNALHTILLIVYIAKTFLEKKRQA